MSVLTILFVYLTVYCLVTVLFLNEMFPNKLKLAIQTIR
jgi:hypothetical protein